MCPGSLGGACGRTPPSPAAPLPSQPDQEDGRERRKNDPAPIRRDGKRGTEKSIKTSTDVDQPISVDRPVILVFDLLRVAENDASLRLTDDEVDALEDLKTDLRRSFRLSVPKNDILRIALHHIIEEYYRSKAESVLLSGLRKKHK